jgi:hypothetical protein
VSLDYSSPIASQARLSNEVSLRQPKWPLGQPEEGVPSEATQ